MSIRNRLCKYSIVIPLMFIPTVYYRGTSLAICEIGLYLNYGLFYLGSVMFTLVWLCCSPFRKNCCNARWTEVLFNLVPVEVLSVVVFAQYHFNISLSLFLLYIAVELVVFIILLCNDCRKIIMIFQRFSVLSLAVIFAIPCFITIFVYDFSSPEYVAAASKNNMIKEMSTYIEKDDIYEINKDLFQCFDEETWNGYSISEKMQHIQYLVDFEAERMGIPSIKCTSKKLSPLVAGQYSNETNEMWIDIQYMLEYPTEDVISAIAHEVYHAFQDYIVKHADWDSELSKTMYFEEIEEWRDNIDNYYRVEKDGWD